MTDIESQLADAREVLAAEDVLIDTLRADRAELRTALSEARCFLSAGVKIGRGKREIRSEDVMARIDALLETTAP